jgi:hypothetical protein
MFDLRSGISNQSILPYNSIFQNKSMFYKDLNLENPYQDYIFYGDLRGRILYKPTKIVTLSTGIDKLYIGEGDRSLFFGNHTDVYLPVWGQSTCTGLGTKYDKSNFNYFY